MMKKLLKTISILLMFGLLIVGCQSRQEEKVENNVQENITHVETSMILKMNDEELEVTLENNETVEALLEQLPMDMTMNELNGNEKFYYMDTSLPTQSENISHIQAGDVMLYGNNCLVIFYKSFTTTYSYTRIGHIDDTETLLSQIGNDSLQVTLMKEETL